MSFFLWIAARDSILTIDNPVKRGQSLVNQCCLSCCARESMNHLLLHCKYAHALWCEVFLMFGIQWVMPKTVTFLLYGWRNWFGEHLSTIWNMVQGCLLWLIWQEHNTNIFEDTDRPVDLLKSMLVGTLFQRSGIWGVTQCISISDFLLLSISLLELRVIALSTKCVHHREHDTLLFQ